jgi:hypothetical protein
MSKKPHRPGPVPPENRPQAHSANPQGQDIDPQEVAEDNAGAAFQEQDPKRRLGGFSGTGEHPRQQPSPRNDGTGSGK